MRAETQYLEQPGYLLVEVHCSWTTEHAIQLIDETKIEAERHGYKRILFDLRRWSRPDTEMTRYWSGEHLASVMGGYFKIAAFANPEMINKFAEDTAVNRGAWFSVFPDKAAALEWLMEEAEKTSEAAPTGPRRGLFDE